MKFLIDAKGGIHKRHEIFEISSSCLSGHDPFPRTGAGGDRMQTGVVPGAA
jgi:hypothetical protein